jgi:hypothetical protein
VFVAWGGGSGTLAGGTSGGGFTSVAFGADDGGQVEVLRAVTGEYL